MLRSPCIMLTIKRTITKRSSRNVWPITFLFLTTLSSLALRDDLRSRDHYHPADDVSHSQVPRHVEQRAGVYETTRGAQGPVRESHGLRGVYLGHDQRVGHRQGKSGQASPHTFPLSHSPLSVSLTLSPTSLFS